MYNIYTSINSQYANVDNAVVSVDASLAKRALKSASTLQPIKNNHLKLINIWLTQLTKT